MPGEKRAKNIAEKKHVPHTGGGQYVRGESVKDLQRQKSQAQGEMAEWDAKEKDREEKKNRKKG